MREGVLPNDAMDSDTVRLQLRAPCGARHREHWAPDTYRRLLV